MPFPRGVDMGVQWACMSDSHSQKWDKTQNRAKVQRQPLQNYREHQTCLCVFRPLGRFPICSLQTALYATNVCFPHASHTLLSPCWIIAVFHRNMKVSNKIIHSKLLTRGKITPLYSFGGTCLLKEGLRRRYLTHEGQNLGGEFCLVEGNWGDAWEQEEHTPVPRDPPMLVSFSLHF